MLSFVGLSTALSLACAKDPGEAATPETTTPAASADVGAPDAGPLASMQAAMDTSVDPCDDFYQYACGGWLATAEIPADRSSTSRLMTIVDGTEAILRATLEAAAADPGADAGKKMLGDFYAACMDTEAIDAAGMTALDPWFERIAAARDAQSLVELSAELRALGVSSFYDMEVWPDDAEPGTNLLQLGQGGLGLPNREFYSRDDDASKALRGAYEAHIARMLQLAGAGEEDASASAAGILAFESALADSSMPLDELRDSDRTFNKTKLGAFEKQTPGIRWKKVLAKGGISEIQWVNVRTPDFFAKLGGHLKKTEIEVLQAYLRYHMLEDLAAFLPSSVDGESFAFASQLTGQTEQQARWKRCVAATGSAMPELLGTFYVDEAFGGQSKVVATEMIIAVEAAFESNLDQLSWMDDETRTRAREKARKIINKVGYPDRWRDYSSLKVDRADYFGSVLSAQRFEYERNAAKAGKPIDPDEWFMPAFILNAYANPTGMEMVFPAGILQPPIFSAEWPMAMNFGSAGAIMGHELTHHFDDQGRKYDADGTLTDWWAKNVEEAFEEKAACVAGAYDTYEVQPGLNVKGQQTLGENIADIGGLKAAHAAYQSWAEKHPGADETGTMTPDQVFFLAFAQTYCGDSKPEMEKMQVLSDVHSPRRFRANGSVSNNPDFLAAFSCEAGRPMHPENACVVW